MKGKWIVSISEPEPTTPAWLYILLGVAAGLVLGLAMYVAYQWGYLP